MGWSAEGRASKSCLKYVNCSVDDGDSWLPATRIEPGENVDEPSTQNSAHYGHGGEGYWHPGTSEVTSRPSPSDTNGYFTLHMQLLYDFRWEVAGGSASDLA